MKQRLGKFGSRFAFEFFLETMHDAIVKGLRENLTSIQPEDMRAMIKENRFPPLEHLDFSAVSDNSEHLERISAIRLMEFIAEARPDLATAIQDMGMPGAEYLTKLRIHLLGMAKHPEKTLAESTKYEPKGGMKLATCDKCGQSWPVTEADASAIKECPFCGGGKDKPKEPAVEDE